MRSEHYRQGDILFIRVDKLPAKTKKRSSNIVAYGEVTGHTHRAVAVDAGDCTLVEDEEGNFFIDAKGPVNVVHEEHDTIALDKGRYEVRHQREYSPETVRRVVD